MERCDTKKKNRKKSWYKQPTWRRKIQKKIKSFGGELFMLEDLSKGINLKTRKGQKVKRKYK